MKTMVRMFIATAVCLTTVTTYATKTQQVAPGEVPEGITAEDWGIVQEAYLKSSNSEVGDSFGYSLAISGNTLVVGAPGEASSATGVNGNQADNSANFSGAAYVFIRDGTNWIQQAYLKASNTEEGDSFGRAVSISGDTIVVGASSEDSSADGVNGNQSDNSAYQSGAAYVFVRNGINWSQQAYLKASNSEGGSISYYNGDAFGSSLSISGDTIVVGAHGEDSNTTGVNGNQSDNSADSAGAAYVFVRNGTTWSQQAYLKASNTDGGDFFSRTAVSVAGNTIVVGAWGEDSGATGVNGNQSDNSAGVAGAAYVFVRNGTIWSQQVYLKASNTDAYDRFGTSVAISSSTVVVGASEEDSSATGVNGDQSDNSGDSVGAAYVFVRSGTRWSQQAYLKTFNAAGYSSYFGSSVAILGDTVAVGKIGSSYTGESYVYTRSGTIWSEQAMLNALNAEREDTWAGALRYDIAISHDIIVTGAPGEDSAATGVNGNQSDNSADGAGAAYTFTGFGSGDYQAVITGYASAATDFRLEWIPVPGWDSVVKCSTDLVNMPFTDLSIALPYPMNSYTDTVSNGKCFYKVDLEP